MMKLASLSKCSTIAKFWFIYYLQLRHSWTIYFWKFWNKDPVKNTKAFSPFSVFCLGVATDSSILMRPYLTLAYIYLCHVQKVCQKWHFGWLNFMKMNQKILQKVWYRDAFLEKKCMQCSFNWYYFLIRFIFCSTDYIIFLSTQNKQFTCCIIYQ